MTMDNKYRYCNNMCTRMQRLNRKKNGKRMYERMKVHTNRLVLRSIWNASLTQTLQQQTKNVCNTAAIKHKAPGTFYKHFFTLNHRGLRRLLHRKKEIFKEKDALADAEPKLSKQ